MTLAFPLRGALMLRGELTFTLRSLPLLQTLSSLSELIGHIYT